MRYVSIIILLTGVVFAQNVSKRTRVAPQVTTTKITPILAKKLVKPTFSERAQVPTARQLQTVVKKPLRTRVDLKKYGYRDMRSFKLGIKKSLGLPKNYPLQHIYVNEIYSDGKRGLFVSGFNPRIFQVSKNAMQLKVISPHILEREFLPRVLNRGKVKKVRKIKRQK
ncbi:hypothetical protein [Candidatus Uabimicrobium amorphum]|uniref:Uncharacterized protein n=1 Tax=Uabimicrobium amorphum TaxID=2596890 RepID=A0A5S9ILQ8_UABAM|nr:hypothetical protein [Candidatus Uabimicrobium amorphum]BBM84199.1 hypothetical protein UABAM_02555 [Candidatus Uabimicrobium amorphum]